MRNPEASSAVSLGDTHPASELITALERLVGPDEVILQVNAWLDERAAQLAE